MTIGGGGGGGAGNAVPYIYIYINIDTNSHTQSVHGYGLYLKEKVGLLVAVQQLCTPLSDLRLRRLHGSLVRDY